MRRVALACLLLCGCAPLETASAAAPLAEARAVAVSQQSGFVIDEDSDLLEFHYAWPAEAEAVPAIARRFRSQMMAARAEALQQSSAGRAAAVEGGWDFHPHSFSRVWTTRGKSDRLLSLESATSFYTGGAHPNHGFGALLWDKAAAREIGFRALFDAPTRLEQLVQPAWCAALDAERLKRREGAKLGGEFDACPDLEEVTFVAADADSNGRFDTIHVIADPYVAGPYAEGEYDIALPVTSAIRAALKAQFRSSFEAAEAQGQ